MLPPQGHLQHSRPPHTSPGHPEVVSPSKGFPQVGSTTPNSAFRWEESRLCNRSPGTKWVSCPSSGGPTKKVGALCRRGIALGGGRAPNGRRTAPSTRAWEHGDPDLGSRAPPLTSRLPGSVSTPASAALGAVDRLLPAFHAPTGATGTQAQPCGRAVRDSKYKVCAAERVCARPPLEPHTTACSQPPACGGGR